MPNLVQVLDLTIHKILPLWSKLASLPQLSSIYLARVHYFHVCGFWFFYINKYIYINGEIGGGSYWYIIMAKLVVAGYSSLYIFHELKPKFSYGRSTSLFGKHPGECYFYIGRRPINSPHISFSSVRISPLGSVLVSKSQFWIIVLFRWLWYLRTSYNALLM